MIIENGTDIVFTEDRLYAKSSVVCDYGIYERTSDPASFDRSFGDENYKLRLILNSNSNATLILKILDSDSRHRVFEINK